MLTYYENYYWKNGLPIGLGKTDQSNEVAYASIADPYHKWISIEEYQKGSFHRIIYDSRLFDFRQLRPENQTAWKKDLLEETPAGTRCLIRNQDERVILIEHYLFEGSRCRECRSLSPQGILLSIQKIFYTVLQDSFNGVILYDVTGRPVVKKIYNWDEEAEQFSTLLTEQWTVQNGQTLISSQS